MLLELVSTKKRLRIVRIRTWTSDRKPRGFSLIDGGAATPRHLRFVQFVFTAPTQSVYYNFTKVRPVHRSINNFTQKNRANDSKFRRVHQTIRLEFARLQFRRWHGRSMQPRCMASEQHGLGFVQVAWPRIPGRGAIARGD
eukprot:SAG31_NODE_13246_length_882_cov_2.425287_1_plen_141_part_00